MMGWDGMGWDGDKGRGGEAMIGPSGSSPGAGQAPLAWHGVSGTRYQRECFGPPGIQRRPLPCHHDASALLPGSGCAYCATTTR